jgi:hypothetical protein
MASYQWNQLNLFQGSAEGKQPAKCCVMSLMMACKNLESMVPTLDPDGF